jgi:hypothetical protein
MGIDPAQSSIYALRLGAGLRAEIRPVGNTIPDEMRAASEPWLMPEPDTEPPVVTWSCFTHSGLLFTSRATGMPDGFSHTRMVSVDTVSPGAALAADAWFSRHWNEQPPAEPAPGVATAGIVESPEAQRNILAHLLHALLSARPLIIAAERESFCEGSRLPALAAFARAALPPALRRGCQVRLFTLRPEFFLQSLGAMLLAVPAEAAGDALRARRDALLLDMEGRRIEGEEPPEDCWHYAERICHPARAEPSAIDRFLNRLDAIVPTAERPSESQCEALSVAYALSVPGAEVPAIQPGPEVNWAGLLRNGDWARARLAMLDAAVSASPEISVEALLHAGQWQRWRAASGCSAGVRQEAAMAWCRSPWWNNRAPMLEDWHWIADDLSGGIGAGHLARMKGERGFFPPIAWFEEEQRSMLFQIADDEARALLTGSAVPAAVKYDLPASVGATVEDMDADIGDDAVGPETPREGWFKRLLGRLWNKPE